MLTEKVNIEDLVEKALPQSPGNLMRVADLLRDFNTPIRTIIETISYDPVLVTRILRLANSPVYALERNVNSIQAAINTVGTKVVHDIVVIVILSGTFAKQLGSSPLAQKIWKHSIAVAVISRELSRLLEMRGTEEVFTCGLLHDIGKLLLFNINSEAFADLLECETESEMMHREAEIFGYNHAQIGSLVAKRWGLPEAICYTIMNHHNSSQSAQQRFVAQIIDVADLVANINGYGLRTEAGDKLLYSESVMTLGFTEQHLTDTWEKVKNAIDEVIATFR